VIIEPIFVLSSLGSLTNTRIPIHERVELPEELIPADSRVEIDAKITAGMAQHWLFAMLGTDLLGYFTAGKRLTTEELQAVQGRIWEE
jgi:hypothetical protein